MIDIHCHILPGADDGPRDLDGSLAMARQAVEQGIDTIIATPHHQNGRYINPRQEVIERVKSFNHTLKQADLELTILPGQEIRAYGELLEDYERGEIVTLGGHSSYVFLEFPSSHVPRFADTLVYDLQLKGLHPIIVHPERNAEIIEHPDKLYELVKKGAAAQLTAASLTGGFGRKIQRFCRQLLEANLAHFIASDAHNTSSRGFHMEEAYQFLEKKYGLDALLYFSKNTELLVQGRHIQRGAPDRVTKKKVLGIF